MTESTQDPLGTELEISLHNNDKKFLELERSTGEENSSHDLVVALFLSIQFAAWFHLSVH